MPFVWDDIKDSISSMLPAQALEVARLVEDMLNDKKFRQISSPPGSTGVLTQVYAGIQRVVDGMGQAVIGLCGDSTTLGAGAGTGAKGLIGAASGRPAAALATFLASAGIPAADNSWFGEGLIQAYQGVTYAQYDTRFQWLGTASHYANGQQTSAGGIMAQFNAANEGVGFTPQIQGVNCNYDTVKVWYCNRTTGSFTVSQPGSGTVAQTITTTGATTIGVATVALTRGSGLCSILWGSGDCWIIGAEYYDSQVPRVNIRTFGHYGDKLTSVTGLVNNTNEWRGGAVIAAMAMDCCFIDMTINSENSDGLGGVPAYQAALQSLATEIAAVGTDVVISTPHAIGTANQGATSNAYVAAAYQVAINLNLPIDDRYKKITPYATWSSALYFDTLHLNAAGNRAKGFQIGRFIRAKSGA